jgi:superfamily II DNA helicase RecQ
MKTLDRTSALDEKEIITKSGRKFRPYYQELLANVPPDLVKEMAQRELDKIEESENQKDPL